MDLSLSSGGFIKSPMTAVTESETFIWRKVKNGILRYYVSMDIWHTSINHSWLFVTIPMRWLIQVEPKDCGRLLAAMLLTENRWINMFRNGILSGQYSVSFNIIFQITA